MSSSGRSRNSTVVGLSSDRTIFSSSGGLFDTRLFFDRVPIVSRLFALLVCLGRHAAAASPSSSACSQMIWAIALAGDLPCFQPHFDRQLRCHPCASTRPRRIVAVRRADEVRGGAVFLHPRKREQPFALDLVEAHGGGVRQSADSSTALIRAWGTNVASESGRPEQNPVFVDAGHVAGNRIAAAQVQWRTCRSGPDRRLPLRDAGRLATRRLTGDTMRRSPPAMTGQPRLPA